MATGSVYKEVMAFYVGRLADAWVSNFRFESGAVSTDPLFRGPGLFTVTVNVHVITNDLELFRRILSEVIVVHAESTTWADEIAVVGFSSAFDLIEDGDPTPTYQVFCTSHPAGFDPAGDPMTRLAMGELGPAW